MVLNFSFYSSPPFGAGLGGSFDQMCSTLFFVSKKKKTCLWNMSSNQTKQNKTNETKPNKQTKPNQAKPKQTCNPLEDTHPILSATLRFRSHLLFFFSSMRLRRHLKSPVGKTVIVFFSPASTNHGCGAIIYPIIYGWFLWYNELGIYIYIMYINIFIYYI